MVELPREAMEVNGKSSRGEQRAGLFWGRGPGHVEPTG